MKHRVQFGPDAPPGSYTERYTRSYLIVTEAEDGSLQVDGCFSPETLAAAVQPLLAAIQPAIIAAITSKMPDLGGLFRRKREDA